MKSIFTIGTRGSQLALWQSNWVRDTLHQHNPTCKITLQTIKTKGDKILDVPLANVGGKGLFVKEIEEALLSNTIDLAVHSMKDMPADIPKGLCIYGVPKRENPKDVLISRNNQMFEDLPTGATIGTSSLRRAAQLKYKRPDIQIMPLRGNVDTRLNKLHTEQLDAIVLAAAGVKRLGLDSHITQYLPLDLMLPAVGQGVLCIEMRQNDQETKQLAEPLNHLETWQAVTAERSFLKYLEGGCQVPIAAYAEIQNNTLSIKGLVASIDGSKLIKESLSGPPDQAKNIGVNLAKLLISKGAKAILT